MYRDLIAVTNRHLCSRPFTEQVTRVCKLHPKALILRAEYLKREGYDTQILEFIDMEHTPKNILIRAIYTGNKGKNTETIRACEEMLHIDPMLGRLLDQQNEEGEKGV